MTTVLCTVYCNLFGMNLKELGPQILGGLAFWGFVNASALQGCPVPVPRRVVYSPIPGADRHLSTAHGTGSGFSPVDRLSVVIVLTWALRGFGNLATIGAGPARARVAPHFGWSVAMLTGFANVYFPDTYHILEVGLQILFYATPIVIPEDLLRQARAGLDGRLQPTGGPVGNRASSADQRRSAASDQLPGGDRDRRRAVLSRYARFEEAATPRDFPYVMPRGAHVTKDTCPMPMISYAQNREDILLARIFAGRREGSTSTSGRTIRKTAR